MKTKKRPMPLGDEPPKREDALPPSALELAFERARARLWRIASERNA